ncbi:MAG TPA: ester cyclase [Acidimicrobiia bacterium]|nr:ester cyclase [Acidimicrobiia bacterium]
MSTNTQKTGHLQHVERHVAFENLHDLDAVMDTFGPDASYDDEPWHEHHRGRDGVRSYYEQLLRAVPDLHIEPHRHHVTDDAVVLECTITGTHEGTWHGLPPTGRRISLPLCGVYTFDEDGRLSGERIYYDRADVLRQVGVFHDPESVRGRVTTALLHPVTMTRIAIRSARRSAPGARLGTHEGDRSD